MAIKLKNLSFVLALMLCLTGFAFGQETTGSVEGTVRDPQGAVVPNVEITLASTGNTQAARPDTTTGFTRTYTADSEGFFRILQVPPGFYSLTSGSASGFGASTVNNVEVVLGRSTLVNLNLTVTGGETTVDVTDSAVAIDPTENAIQTNITAQTIDLLPKGTNFTSLLQIAPAVRNEPLSGGFQIDGASGSENTFIIDGQEVSNFRTGTLNINNNIPFQFVQEIQVRSSGFDAEFGGATGGVITVVTRGGGNEFRGEMGIEFRPSELQAGPRSFLNNTGGVEYLRPRRDGGTDEFPFVSLGGPVIKDRLWFFGAYAPQYINTVRTLDYINPNPALRAAGNRFPTQTYRQQVKREYAFGRLDLQPTDRIRMTGSYTWNPIAQQGVLPLFSSTTGTIPSINFPGEGFRTGPALLDRQGGRQTSNNTAGSITWTPTDRLTLSARGGYNFLNEKIGNYGVPAVTGQFRQIVQIVGTADASAAPANFGLAAGTQNFPGFSQLLFDVSRRRTFDADASYLLSNFGGRHQFKGGYQFNGISNQALSTLVDTGVFRFGQTIAQVSGRAVASTAGAIGAGFLQRFGVIGSAGSDNQAFYIQDSYQPFNRLTLNLGVRAEKENSPSFAAGAPGITFDYGDKIAPRLGFALDVTGNGRNKIFGSYGWFYDRFKYELPRGSFGGNFFRNDYFEIFPGQTLANFTRQTIIGTNGDPIGGLCPLTGSTGLTRCQLDFRIPSNLPGNTLDLGAVDPDIEAFRQSEITVGFERDLGNGFLFGSRYTHKQVDVAVEDIGTFASTGGEAYVIGNPGRGLAAELAEANGLLPLEAVRDYDAFEVRVDKRFARAIYFNSSYTYSRLFGNYAGLASSDEPTGGVGRASPNVNRNFDLPFIGFSALGQPDNGRLATDRPHSFKFSGAYTYDWSANNSTELSGFTIAQSGTPVTTRFSLFGVTGQILNGRGDLGRTAAFTQTDLGLRHKYRFGNDGRFAIGANIDVLNVFNEANELGRFEALSSSSPNLGGDNPATPLVVERGLGISDDEIEAIAVFQRTSLSGRLNDFIRGTGEFAGGTNPVAPTVNPEFNLPNNFQVGRTVRFGFRFLF
ncbi:MAG: TonB-dependent receptor [Pyrinomonadaceae bacterium MAG19_C2-C3]|nr:TonB-dependent receptor [Pyrinomonadaceae bacterium MAG19_C2-C3]